MHWQQLPVFTGSLSKRIWLATPFGALEGPFLVVKVGRAEQPTSSIHSVKPGISCFQHAALSACIVYAELPSEPSSHVPCHVLTAAWGIMHHSSPDCFVSDLRTYRRSGGIRQSLIRHLVNFESD